MLVEEGGQHAGALPRTVQLTTFGISLPREIPQPIRGFRLLDFEVSGSTRACKGLSCRSLTQAV